MNNKKIKYPNAVGSLGVVLIILISALIISPIYFAKDYLGGFLYILLTSLLPFVLTIWFVNFIYKSKYGIPLRFDFKPNHIIWYPVIFAIALSLGVISDFLSSFLPTDIGFMKSWFDSINNSFITLLKDSKWGFIIVVCLIAPIFEELIFRGIILRGMLNNYSPWKAIFISALLFGLIHGNPWQFVGAVIVGMFLGWIYHRTKSILASIFVHFTINTSSTIMLFMGENNLEKGIFEMGETTSLYEFVLAVIIAAILWILLDKKLPKQKKTKLVFTTHNQNKLAEVREMMHPSIELISLNELNFTQEIIENGNSLDENALIKAEFIHNKFAANCFSDDTGLEVDALDGEPGIYSARYAGEDCDSEKNMQKLLYKLSDKTDRTARFRTVIKLILNDEIFTFEGICEGEIITDFEGEKGFGYDPIFRPKGYSQTFAQMDISDKNAISHRGKAMNKLIDFLNEIK